MLESSGRSENGGRGLYPVHDVARTVARVKVAGEIADQTAKGLWRIRVQVVHTLYATRHGLDCRRAKANGHAATVVSVLPPHRQRVAVRREAGAERLLSRVARYNLADDPRQDLPELPLTVALSNELYCLDQMLVAQRQLARVVPRLQIGAPKHLGGDDAAQAVERAVLIEGLDGVVFEECHRSSI